MDKFTKQLLIGAWLIGIMIVGGATLVAVYNPSKSNTQPCVEEIKGK